MPACRELGITLVPYSLLGRGLLTGALGSIDDLAADDFRRGHPRWQDGDPAVNLALVEQIRSIAARYGSTPGRRRRPGYWRAVRTWCRSRVPNGAGTLRNMAALRLTVKTEDLDRLSGLRPVGDRYPDMSWLERDTAPLPR